MEVECIPFKQTGYFSDLICDYLDEKQELRSFYNRFPQLENFKAQIVEKEKKFPKASRKVLANVLLRQYQDFELSENTQRNISKLEHPKSFTIVTGHQLNLFTGPLYFLYKIISTVKLAQVLKENYPEYEFVPVYWMATEDHDFEEIHYFNYNGKKLQWNRTSQGAVGRLDTDGLEEVLNALLSELPSGVKAASLKKLFTEAYLEYKNLSDATRYLTNALFGEYGLVILDGDSPELKRLLIPHIKDDLLKNSGFKMVSNTIEDLKALKQNYNIQVNPREINYFYLTEELRERIVFKDGSFEVLNTKLKFSKTEILNELEKHPERFSPNVISRPLYQEVILPNLCYIGGGGELAYWLELKTSFEQSEVPFPILLLRNSALLISAKQARKIQKLNLEIGDLFLRQSSLINKKIREISNIDINFSPQKKWLEEQFKELYTLAEQTDPSFLGAVKAQEVKQKKGLEHLEKRLLKAQKRKLRDHVTRMTEIQNELFPNFSLQERNVNFSELYLELGEQLIPGLMEVLDPLEAKFTILKY